MKKGDGQQLMNGLLRMGDLPTNLVVVAIQTLVAMVAETWL